jgi:hypothetical protein
MVTRSLRVSWVTADHDEMAEDDTATPRGNPRIYELIENAPKTGTSPTIWAFPAVVGWLKVASQPVPGPWPPHQQPRPDPDDEGLPVAIADPDDD